MKKRKLFIGMIIVLFVLGMFSFSAPEQNHSQSAAGISHGSAADDLLVTLDDSAEPLAEFSDVSSTLESETEPAAAEEPSGAEAEPEQPEETADNSEKEAPPEHDSSSDNESGQNISADERSDASSDKDTESSSDNDTDTSADADQISDEEETPGQAGQITYSGNGFEITADCEGSGVPEGTEIEVSEIRSSDKEYSAYYKSALKAIRDDSEDQTLKTGLAKFYDISLVTDGEVIEPDNAVNVTISYDKGVRINHNEAVSDNIRIVHFNVNEKTGRTDAEVLSSEQVDAKVEDGKMTEATFEAESFSVYAVIYAKITRTVITSSGETWEISAEYDESAGIPADSELSVREITPSEKDYDKYISKAENTLGWDYGSSLYAKVFDISIVRPDGIEVQPGSPVRIRAELKDAGSEGGKFSVVHFGRKTEEMAAETEGRTVSFRTDGFSAYAIVTGPSDVSLEWSRITTLDALKEKAAGGIYIGTTSGYYLTDHTAAGSKDASTTGIVKTTPAQSYPVDSAVKYYIEQDGNSESSFYIYCLSGDTRQYVRNTGDKDLYLTSDKDERTAFNVLVDGNGRFRFQNGNRYWNMWNGDGGNHIAAWTSANDGNNYFYIWEHTDYEGDPYGIDGTTTGLMFWSDGISGKALMAESADGTANALAAKDLTVMAKKNNNTTKLFVPSDSDISMWTFEWIAQDQYYLRTTEGESTKYLSITDSGLKLISEPGSAARIRVIPGTGNHAGEICLKSENRTLTYSGSIGSGFNTGGKTGSEWLHLVSLSELTKDYVRTYSAEKVSVSDNERVSNGARVIVYTRSWNEETKKYEYYAIDHDGSLVRCYESGDDIQWVSGLLNTMLWNFVEYTEADGSLTYYYELFNQYSEKYIAPQVTGGQILSKNKIGINMNGRRNGKYYSPIVAWDTDNYSYAGLKVEGGKIVACPIDEADDFYFAVMRDQEADDKLHTVPTVDNNKYGITMKIVDFGGEVGKYSNSSDTTRMQHNVMGDSVYRNGNATSGLLSTDLKENGFPQAEKTGESLGTLFSGAKEVNHLFISSTYSSSGYFEYDSTQNFAHLNDDNTFTVYQELGTMDNNSGKFFTHGQFMPFNDIEAGVFSSNNRQNTTSATGSNLPGSDPRKFERLYLVKNPNYFMGVELEASFVQTPNGLDDWGHDIIYEFAGDDDFWLYVDGELIIDLGGIHDALPGSVNYRTGEVNVNGKKTTLRALFESNYRGRNPDASDDEVNEYLMRYFEGSSSIFKDYSSHTMKIFYMERGAGASNLHMRFNLASVRKGTVQLSKVLGGVDAAESVLAEFPYQIRYKKNDREYLLSNSIDGTRDNTDYVFYKGTTTPVKFAEEFTADGITYENVFLLKPGETAEISFPTFGADDEGPDSYNITECGINTEIYKSVTANGQAAISTQAGETPGRADYSIPYASTDERATVTYKNDVDPEALRTLTFTKKLFREDGTTAISHDADPTTFSFRLYLGTEFEDEPSLANMHTYHVRDAGGNYCRWDASAQKLVSIGKSDYSELSDEEQKSATFHTSMNGAISKIPVDYTVEVREVLAGTRFRIQERPGEIPDGYSFQKYVYNRAEYKDPETNETAGAEAGVTDTVVSGEDPHADICNLKGWGLRINKKWSDKEYMSAREPAFFAVYTDASLKGDGTELKYVEDTLREMPYDEDPQTIYWYFRTLPVAGTTFSQYEIREVVITGGTPAVTEDGAVSNAAELDFEPVADGGEVKMNGEQKGESESSEFTYTVLYDKGAASQDSNVRVDTVTNYRPGVILKKTDWDGSPLAGAVFKLEDSRHNTIGEFTSDDEGGITVAFLTEDADYYLTEIRSPDGYYGLQEPLTIRFTEDNLNISGADEEWYTAINTDTPTLIVKNRPCTLEAVKIDGDTGRPIRNVEFALYKQMTVDGVTAFDLNPVPGYETLKTDAKGVVPEINEDLPAGTYELREKSTPGGYQALSGYIPFTISRTGRIILGNEAPSEVSLSEDIDKYGSLAYTMTVRNYTNGMVTIHKTGMSGEEEKDLKGARFRLTRFTVSGSGSDAGSGGNAAGSWVVVSEYEDIDMTDVSSFTLEKLSAGRYCLTETAAPTGYVILDKNIYFNIEAGTGVVALTDETGEGVNTNTNVSQQDKVVTVVNHSGAVLPASGGEGPALFYLLGTLLTAGALLALAARLKQSRN